MLKTQKKSSFYYSKKRARFIASKLQYKDFILRANDEEFRNSYTRYTLELSILDNMLKFASTKSDIWKINSRKNSIKKILKEQMNITVD